MSLPKHKVKYDGFGLNKNSSTKYGAGGITGGGNKYDQIKIKNDKFIVTKEAGLNRHKANVKTDKPFDAHIDKP